MIPFKATLGTFIVNIRVPEKNASKYIYYYLSSGEFKDEVHKRASTTTNISNISVGKLQQIFTPLPPLPEQHKIVEIIEELFSELDKGVESLKKAREQLKTYRQAVLKAAFEGSLSRNLESDESGNINSFYKDVLEEKRKGNKAKTKNYGEINSTQYFRLPDLPENWKWIKLGNISYGVEYGSSKKSEKQGRVPVLRMGNIQNGRFDWNDLVFSNDDNEISKYKLKKNDVLFNRTNSPELVGKTAIFKGEMVAIFAGYLIRINQLNNINPDYLNYFLNSKVARDYGNSVKTDGVNQSNINGQKLSNYPFPLCLREEQDQIFLEIDSRFSICDHIEKTIDESLTQSEALRQSILKQAFLGKLTEKWRKENMELLVEPENNE